MGLIFLLAGLSSKLKLCKIYPARAYTTIVVLVYIRARYSNFSIFLQRL